MSRGNRDGYDDRLSRYAKRLGAKKRTPAPNTPYFKQVIKETWEKIFELHKATSNQVPRAALFQLIPRRNEHIQAALFALEKAKKIEIHGENNLISVVFS